MQDLVSKNNVNLLLIDQWLQEERASIEEIGKSVTSIFCLSDKDLTIQYLNPAAYQWLKVERSGFDLTHSDLRSYYHPRVSQKLINRIEKKAGKDTSDEIFYDIDKVWFPKLSEYELCLIASKVSNAFDGLLISMETISESNFIDKKLSRLAEEVRFVQQNEHRFVQLTEREKEIIVLLAHGNNNPDIAEVLFISRKTVEQHRKNINKKLGVSSLLDLIRYAQAYELI